MKYPISQAHLKTLLHYEPVTGVFTWLPRANDSRWTYRYAGKQAGVLRNGYRIIKINRRPFIAAHLAFIYVYGIPPKNQIDHIDCNRANDRIINLREATSSQNCSNRLHPCNTSGFKGVSWHKPLSQWRVQICKDQKVMHVGYYNNIEEAKSAYIRKAKELHGEFARWS